MWDKIVEGIAKANDFVNGLVWGWPMIVLILGTGILLTVLTKFLQIRKFGTSVNATLGETFRNMGKKGQRKEKKENSISPFEAFATAISGTVGTGNIIGVTSAIMTGGPGAVFWMWISAFFGMVTNYSENVLGMYFRKKERNGDFSGGPAYYLSEGVGRGVKGKFGSFLRGFGKTLGVMAAVFCTFAAIGMSGVQTNKISSTYQEIIATFSDKADPTVVAIIVGVIVAIVLALVILGGIKGIGRTTALLVPFMSVLFIAIAFLVVFSNIANVGKAFEMIFSNIFEFKSMGAGLAGYAFAQIIQKGLARGIFSNEAGLGSSVIAHSASENREPVKQGFWGIFEVFFDTFVICTLTALMVLVSTDENTLFLLNEAGTGVAGVDTTVSMNAFRSMFAGVASAGVRNVFSWIGMIAYGAIIPLFAFTTIVAWSYYGEKSIDFLFRKTGAKGRKIATVVFKVLYVLLVIVASVLGGDLVWAISDTFNGLMALPNLIGLICMCVLVAKITKNYFDRKKGKDVAPMLSAYPEQNEEFIRELAVENGEIAQTEAEETAEERA